MLFTTETFENHLGASPFLCKGQNEGCLFWLESHIKHIYLAAARVWECEIELYSWTPSPIWTNIHCGSRCTGVTCMVSQDFWKNVCTWLPSPTLSLFLRPGNKFSIIENLSAFLNSGISSVQRSIDIHTGHQLHTFMRRENRCLQRNDISTNQDMNTMPVQINVWNEGDVHITLYYIFVLRIHNFRMKYTCTL